MKQRALSEIDFKIVMAMLSLIVVGYFGIQAHLAQLKIDALPLPVMQSEYASQFAAWHGISGAVYLIECLLGVALVFNVFEFKHM